GAGVDRSRRVPGKSDARLALADAVLDGLDLRLHVLKLSEQLLDLIVEPANIRSHGEPPLAPAIGEVLPQLHALAVVQPADLQRERIDVFIAVVAEQIVRQCFQYLAEDEKQTEIEALLIAL